jgi:hypothetical protein
MVVEDWDASITATPERVAPTSSPQNKLTYNQNYAIELSEDSTIIEQYCSPTAWSVLPSRHLDVPYGTEANMR